MALTKEQWASKIRTFLPQWFFEVENNNIAYINGLSAALAEIQSALEQNIEKSFIENSSGTLLELHGSERVVSRATNETDASYRERIRLLLNLTNYSELMTAIKAALNNGEPILIENDDHSFLGDDEFGFYLNSDSAVLTDQYKNWNWFTVLIPPQTGGDENTIRRAIINTLEENKALGVTYDVVCL